MVLLLLILADASSPAYVQAQGEEGVQEILLKVAGPYQITVAASSAKPAIGPLYLWITVTDVSTSVPVTDAQVRIVAQRSGDVREGEAIALHSPIALGTYTADINLLEPGTWSLSFLVSKPPLDEVAVDTTLLVRESLRNLGVGTLAWVLVVAVLVLGATYVWWSTRRRAKRRGETP